MQLKWYLEKKIKALNVFIRKKQISQSSNIIIHLKIEKNEEQIKFKLSRRQEITV